MDVLKIIGNQTVLIPINFHHMSEKYNGSGNRNLNLKHKIVFNVPLKKECHMGLDFVCIWDQLCWSQIACVLQKSSSCSAWGFVTPPHPVLSWRPRTSWPIRMPNPSWMPWTPWEKATRCATSLWGWRAQISRPTELCWRPAVIISVPCSPVR